MSVLEAVTANNISRARRVGYAGVSALCGWLASQLVCLPFNLVIAARDTEGQARLFVETLLAGLLAWGSWTLFLGLVGWVLVALPLVVTVSPCLMVRLRKRILWIAVGLALAGVVSEWNAFREPTNVTEWQRFMQMLPYASFALSYAVVTAAAYIQLSKRRLDRLAN